MTDDVDDITLHRHTAVWIILGLWLASWVQIAARFDTEEGLVNAATAYGAVTPAIWGGQWWRLLSALFLQLDFVELLLAGVVMCIAGRWLEERLGPLRLIVVYVVSGLCGELVGLAFSESEFASGQLGHDIITVPPGLAGVLAATAVCALAAQWKAAPDDASEDNTFRFNRVSLAVALLGLVWMVATYAPNLLNFELHAADVPNALLLAAQVACGVVLMPLLGRIDAPERSAQWGMLVVAAILFAFGAQAALRPQQQRLATYYFENGLRELKDGDTVGATRDWETAASVDPTLAKAHFMLSLMYGDCKLHDAAVRELDEARRLAPSMPALLTRLAEQAEKEGETALATNIWRSLVRDAGDGDNASSGMVLDNAASYFSNQGDTDDAQALWARLAREHAADADDALRIAQAQMRTGAAAQAEALVSQYIEAPAKAASKSPDKAPTENEKLQGALRLLRANARAELGRFEDAMRDADATASLPHPTWETLYLRARLYLWWAMDERAGRTAAHAAPEKLKSAWDAAGKAASTAHERDLTTGYRAFIDANLAEAENRARLILQRRPKDAEALYLLGLSLRAQGHAEQGDTMVAKAAALEPGHREFAQARKH